MKEEEVRKLEELHNKLGKRPKTVLGLLLKNGEVSTYELGQLGYDQPPRAAQDLKEAGVKLKTKFGKHPETGARMAIYIIDENQSIDLNSKARGAFPMKFRKEMIKINKSRCACCETEFSSRFLQIDHKIPFIVGEEPDKINVLDFQLLCAPHQRAKSWECEHCVNLNDKNLELCNSCYWASPDDYDHIATKMHKTVNMSFFDGEDQILYNKLKKEAKSNNISTSEMIKLLLNKSLEK